MVAGKPHISALGYCIPEGRLSNTQALSDLREANEDRLSANDIDLLMYGNERKFEFLGLKSRSVCQSQLNENYTNIALHACRQVIKKSGISVNRIDCIIAVGITNPFIEPSFAMILAGQLGISQGDFFDINDTCNGFLKSIDIATLYLTSKRYCHILIVACESPHELINGMQLSVKLNHVDEIDQRLSGLIAGCGAGAVIVSSEGKGKTIENYGEQKETRHWDASSLRIPDAPAPPSRFSDRTSGFWSDARLISSTIIKDMPRFIRDTLNDWRIDIQEIDLFILHQLGRNVNFALLDKLDIAAEKSPVNTFEYCGNMATANIPINLAIAEEENRLKEGTSVLLLGSACGLSYAMAHVIW